MCTLLLLLILIFNTCGRITYWFFQLKKNRKRTTHHPACGGVPLPFCYAKWDDKDLPPPYGGSPSSRKRQDGEASRFINFIYNLLCPFNYALRIMNYALSIGIDATALRVRSARLPSRYS